jgi:hypothetical protein
MIAVVERKNANMGVQPPHACNEEFPVIGIIIC